LTLYARRECTEQLRKNNDVSIEIVAREVIEGVYVVTARAKMPNGRTDESIGAVAIENLKGDNRANAVMKAETKAKRRVTLSICGLSFLDETEIDTVKGAGRMVLDDKGEIIGQDGGSQEAADAVAEAKLAALRLVQPQKPINDISPIQAPTEPKAPFSMARSIEEFGKLKVFAISRLGPGLGESLYYRVLDKHDAKHANDLKTATAARACYKALATEIDEAARQLEATRDADTF
jgi:hypothetical protein